MTVDDVRKVKLDDADRNTAFCETLLTRDHEFSLLAADVAKLQQNEIKSKKDQTCVFLGNHQATQKKSFRKGLSLT